MAVFIVSHNLQVISTQVPAISADELALALKNECEGFMSISSLSHPHWSLRMESELDANQMAESLLKAWQKMRLNLGHEFSHTVMALGGRKDENANPNSPLQIGNWGVDVVETLDADAFLRSINWDALRSGRPADAVFERLLKAS